MRVNYKANIQCFKLIKISFFLCLPTLVFGQLSRIKNYYNEKGLYCKSIYNIRQDARGILWIGTDNGLHSFDGKVFSTYNETDRLKDTEILCNIPIDGKIFIIPLNEKMAFLEDGTLTTKEENKALDLFPKGILPHAIKDTIQQRLIISSSLLDDTYYTYYKDTIYNHKLNGKYRISYYHNQLLYLIDSNQKLTTLNLSNNEYTTFDDPTIPQTKIKDVFVGKAILTILTEHNIHVYDLMANAALHFKYKIPISEKVRAIYFDNYDNLWIAYSHGKILYFNTKTQQKTVLFNDYIINDVFTDRDKNIWFSTRNNGLFFWSAFHYSNYLKKNVQWTEGKNILRLSGQKDTIYFGLQNMKAGVSYPEKSTLLSLEESESLKGTNTILTTDKKIFFVTNDVIHVYRRDLKFIKKLSNPILIKKLSTFNNDTLIVASSGHASLLDINTNKVTAFFNHRAFDAIKFSKDSIFVCSNLGLFKVHATDKGFTNRIPEFTFLNGDKATSDRYAFATNTGGVFMWINNEITQITEEHGLLSNTIQKVMFETPQVLWVLGNKGLNRIVFDTTYQKFDIDSFTIANGIPIHSLNDFYIYEDLIYFATAKGLEVISKSELISHKQYRSKAKLILNSITYKDSTFTNNHINIPYSKNSLRIHVSYPDFNSFGATTFKYKFANESQYNTTDASNIILSSLPQGVHELTIFGLNSSNTPSTQPLKIYINVVPHFWQTLWFKALLLSLFIIGIYTLVIQTYIKRKKRKAEKVKIEKKLIELEVQVIKNQMNPHFIANCLNAIKLLIYQKDFKNAQLYIDRFTRMLRFNLEYSHNTFISIREEIDYLTDYLELEKLRFENMFNYQIDYDNSSILDLKTPSFLIQPFIENAIKHAFVANENTIGNINIIFSKITAREINITITDDGLGILYDEKIAAKKRSKGIALIKKRIKSYEQIFNTLITLSITNLKTVNQKGTRIQLKILNQNAT